MKCLTTISKTHFKTINTFTKIKKTHLKNNKTRFNTIKSIGKVN